MIDKILELSNNLDNKIKLTKLREKYFDKDIRKLYQILDIPYSVETNELIKNIVIHSVIFRELSIEVARLQLEKAFTEVVDKDGFEKQNNKKKK